MAFGSKQEQDDGEQRKTFDLGPGLFHGPIGTCQYKYGVHLTFFVVLSSFERRRNEIAARPPVFDGLEEKTGSSSAVSWLESYRS